MMRFDLSSQAYFRNPASRARARKALFRRWPKLGLAVDAREIRWRARPGMNAIDRLPVAVAGCAAQRGRSST